MIYDIVSVYHCHIQSVLEYKAKTANFRVTPFFGNLGKFEIWVLLTSDNYYRFSNMLIHIHWDVSTSTLHVSPCYIVRSISPISFLKLFVLNGHNCRIKIDSYFLICLVCGFLALSKTCIEYDYCKWDRNKNNTNHIIRLTNGIFNVFMTNHTFINRCCVVHLGRFSTF